MKSIENLKKYKVLLVIEDTWVRDSMEFYFRWIEWDMESFQTAEELLPVLEKSNGDIVISNYRLAGMNGVEFLKQVDEKLPYAGKILILDSATAGVCDNAVELNAVECLIIPFNINQLSEAIRKILLLDPEELSETGAGASKEKYQMSQNHHRGFRGIEFGF